ncbi:DUF2569 family protein [Rapidithrix thailandica]|uniref:DUF2569 family protein n=1 Tax=Rapidithrix thailandica TaxID=413964 RepID=UPI003D2C917B
MKGKPIGGWLWVIMINIIASRLQILISIITTIEELLADDWNLYFQTTDERLPIRMNIYVYFILSMVIGLIITIWSLVSFFQRKRKFTSIFMGLLGYFLLTGVLNRAN